MGRKHPGSPGRLQGTPQSTSTSIEQADAGVSTPVTTSTSIEQADAGVSTPVTTSTSIEQADAGVSTPVTTSTSIEQADAGVSTPVNTSTSIEQADAGVSTPVNTSTPIEQADDARLSTPVTTSTQQGFSFRSTAAVSTHTHIKARSRIKKGNKEGSSSDPVQVTRTKQDDVEVKSIIPTKSDNAGSTPIRYIHTKQVPKSPPKSKSPKQRKGIIARRKLWPSSHGMLHALFTFTGAQPLSHNHTQSFVERLSSFGGYFAHSKLFFVEDLSSS